VPPPGQRMRFYAEAGQGTEPEDGFVCTPAGGEIRCFSALGDCVKLIQKLSHYEGEERAAS